MRSRTVSRPWSRCRLTLSTPPISRANASRRARSSSSGFQVILVLRLDDFIMMGRYRKRLSLQAIAEEFSVGAIGQFALHFGKQGVADILIERRGVGMTRRRARHRDAAAGAFMQTERVGRAGELEIDQMKTVRNDEADGARQLLGDILQPQPD